MKILMTTCGGFVRGIKGWPEYGLAKELIKMGHEVVGLTSANLMKKMKAKRKEIIDGITVKRFNPILPGSFFWMAKQKFDIVHAHFPGYMAPISSYAALLKKIGKNVPLVHTIHGIYHDPFLVNDIENPFETSIKYENMQRTFPLNPLKLPNWFAHLTIFEADRILALTNFERRELKKYGVPLKRITVVPNGINLSLYENLPSKKYFRNKFKINGHIILFVGQPRRRKGPEYLIKAMPKIIKAYDDAILIFVGYRKNLELEILVKKMKLEKNVKFLGFLSEKDKISAYRSADVFCLPTNYEGFGIVFIEAMACGTPIVTTDTPGIKEIVVPHRNGILVPPRNSGKLAEAIIKIFDSRNLQKIFSNNNKKDVKKYDWPIVAKRVEKLYKELVYE